jgi:UDP-glucose:(glucosyl)LPS beta-1,3-glucosyltransferase
MNTETLYPLVSVVIPAYNAEKTIASSLKSIIAQDYPNIEVIVVNDASTDATEQAARSVIEGCGRPFRIITHKANRGVAAARNTGIDAMQGEFLWYMDADDMAEQNLVTALYSLIQKFQCDLSFCGYKNMYEDGSPDVFFPVKLEGADYCSGEEILRLRVFNKVPTPVCGTLLRKQFLLETGLRFHEGCTAGEDVEFLLKVFCRARQVAYISDCLHIYFHHAGMGSLHENNSKEKQIRRYRDHTEALIRSAQYLIEYAPSEKIRQLAENLLMPVALTRRFTLCAKTNNRAEFDRMLSDSATRKALGVSKKNFFQKPDVYLKAFALLHLPDIYYRLRRG